MSIYSKETIRQRALTALLDGEFGRKRVEIPPERRKVGSPGFWWKSLAPKGKNRVWARFLSKAEWNATSELFRYPTLRLVIQELKNIITELGGWQESVFWDEEVREVLFDLKAYYHAAKKERDEIMRENRISSASMPIHELAKINKTNRRVICRIRKFLILSFIGSGRFLVIGDKGFWEAVNRGLAVRELSKKRGKSVQGLNKKQNRPRTEKEKNPKMPSVTLSSVTPCSATLERAAAMSQHKSVGVPPDVPLSRHGDGSETVEKIDRLERACLLDSKLEVLKNLRVDVLNVLLGFDFTLPAKEFNGMTLGEVSNIFGFSLEKTDLGSFLYATAMNPRKKQAPRKLPPPLKLVDDFLYMRTETNDDMPPCQDGYWYLNFHSGRKKHDHKESMASSSDGMKRQVRKFLASKA